MAEKVKLSKDGSSIDFVQSESIPTSVKKFRQSPEIEGFYRFIFENDLQKEAFEILERIIIGRKAKKKTDKVEATAIAQAAKKTEAAATKEAASKLETLTKVELPKKLTHATPVAPTKTILKKTAPPAKTILKKAVPVVKKEIPTSKLTPAAAKKAVLAKKKSSKKK